MVLRLIGAGLPRTGTSSLRDALTHLLGAPVYHMSEALAHPEHVPTWVAAIEGRTPDWERFLDGYAAGVDSPVADCWRDLAAAYPDAPVLLSHRDPHDWLRSMEATVLPRTRAMLAREGDPATPLFQVIFRDVIPDVDPVDRAAAAAAYQHWNDLVRAEVPSDRLVEWRPGDGWEPICAALGLAVPDRPFPHANSTADYQARQRERSLRDQQRTSGLSDDRI